MKSRIGFICIGQAGGNIGQLFEGHGYQCLFVNSSLEDLETLNVKYRYHIPYSEGCARDREVAVQLIKKNYREVLDVISDILHHQELIYLVFAAGGGTGSGSAPILLELLNQHFPQKFFGCIIVLPALSETPKTNYNAFNCYKEVTNIQKLATVFSLDNEKGNKFTINNTFVSLFNQVIDIPNHKDIRGNMDPREVWKLLTTRGNTIISTAVTNDTQNITGSIIRSWEQNIFADMEPDKQITFLGLSLTNEINIDDLTRVVGLPYDTFTGYNKNLSVTILSGLSYPKTRINAIKKMLDENKEAVKNSILNSQTNKITDDLNLFDDFQLEPEEITISTEDIFSKY